MPAKSVKQQRAKLEDVGREIVHRLLGEDDGTEERAEVNQAKAVLDSLKRLQSSLGEVTPEVQRELTTIRAAANFLIRMHQEPGGERRP